MNEVFSYAADELERLLLERVGTLFTQMEAADENRRSAILGLVTTIVQRVRGGISPKLDQICRVLFAVPGCQSAPLCKEAMVAFSSLILFVGESFVLFAAPFLGVVRHAFTSGDPDVIACAALTLRDFCKVLREHAVECLTDEADVLFEILTAAREKRPNVPCMLMARGTGYMNVDKVAAVWELVIGCSRTDLDPHDANDMEHAPQLFDGVCIAFSALLRSMEDLATAAGSQLRKDRPFVSDVKNRLFSLFQRIW
jgi:hypothetical protein